MIENLDKMDLEIIWISPDHDKTTAIGRIIISMGKLVKRQGRKTMGLRMASSMIARLLLCIN